MNSPSMSNPPLHGGSFGKQTGLRSVAGFVVSETRHQRHQALPRHMHERANVNLVLAGAYAESVAGSTQVYRPHTLVAKPAGEVHANHFRESGARCLLIEVSADRAEFIHSCSSLFDAPCSMPAGYVAAIGLRILDELRHDDALATFALESLLLDFIVSATRRRHRVLPESLPAWMRRAIALIHDAKPGKIDLSLLAAEANVHPAHVSRAFRKYLRTTPGEYARQVQIERAVQLLLHSQASIGTIALQAGFFDQSHFTRAIKRKTGMSPGQLRRAARAC